jgi:hypothetical protein
MPLGRHVHTAMIIKYACLTEKKYITKQFTWPLQCYMQN